MIRLACVLQLVAIALTLNMLRDTTSATAMPLVFIGSPCLGLGLALAAVALWRARQRSSPLRASSEHANHPATIEGGIMRSVLALLSVLVLGSLAPPTRGADDGATIWKEHCQGCHGANGAGDTIVGKAMHVPSLKDPKWVAPDALVKIEDTVRNGAGEMPPMGSRLSADEVAAVAHYAQSLAGAK